MTTKPQPPTPDNWRKPSAPASAPASAAASAGQPVQRASIQESWKHAPGTLSARGYVWLVLRRLTMTAILIGLVAMLLWLLLSLYRPVPVVACFASAYQPPLLPIPLTHEDAALLDSLSRSNISLFRSRPISLVDKSPELASANAEAIIDTLAKQVAAFKPGGPDKDMVVVYVSMLGAVDSSGQACLVPPGIEFAESSLGDGRAVTIDRFLRRLRGPLAERTGLLVVLDACHGRLQWPLGLLDGGFAAAVETAVAAADLPRTWVLLPAASGQSSQASLLEGGSVFARFFTAGLRGAADAAASGNRNGVVELGELAAYLGTGVDRWSVARHGARQTPLLIPAVDKPRGRTDARLANVQTWEAEREMADRLAAYRSARSPMEGDSWLRDRWRAAAELSNYGVHTRPIAWQQYLQSLIRAENLLRAGPGYALERRRTETRVERLEMELTSDHLPNSEYLPVLRMPWLERASSMPEASETLTSWRRGFVDRVTKPTPEPAPQQAATTAIEWNQRANVAWAWLMSRIDGGEPVDRELLGRWLENLGRPPASVPAEPPQIVAARTLFTDGPDASWRSAPRLPGQLLMALGKSRESRFTPEIRADGLVAAISPPTQSDQNRRLAFDLFFLGDPAELGRAADLARDSIEQSNRAAVAGRVFAEIYDCNDRVLDELPWLAAWWSAEVVANRMSALSRNDGLSDDTVPQDFDWPAVIDASIVLESTIATLEADALKAGRNAEALLQSLRERRGTTEATLQPLRDAFATTVEELQSSAPDSADTLGRIRRVLHTPLVRGDRRMRLMGRAIDLEKQFATVVPSDAASLDRLPVPDAAIVAAPWTSWRSLVVHPLVPVLTEKPAGVPARPERPEEVTAALGEQIADIDAAIAAANRDTPGTDDKEGLGSDLGARSLAQREDLMSRNVAAVSSARASFTLSPHVRMKYVNWHDRMVAAAHDALDDFWRGDGLQPGSDQSPWCFTAAKLLVDKAAELIEYSRMDHGGAIRREVLSRLASLNADGAGRGATFGTVRLEPRTMPVVRSDKGDLPLNTATLSPRDGVPPGLAAVWFAESERATPLRIAAADDGDLRERLPLEVSADRRETKLAWRIDYDAVSSLDGESPSSNTGEVLDLVAWFRGHRLVVAAPLAPATSVRVMEWEQQPPRNPRVTVRGDVSRNQTVAVVFDCSGSMGQRLPDGRTRLEAGRMAVYEVLEEIARDGGWTASLWLYGHRTRWSRDRRGRYSADLTDAGKRDRDKKTAAGDGNYSLLPGNDVEQVMDMQPLVPLQVVRIRGLLDEVVPGGETPLYLAINEALRGDFPPLNPGPGHVLVVTDGANDQSGGRITSSSDVLRTLSWLNVRRAPQDRVRIDVIGFDLLAGVYDRQIRLQDLQSLAADSGGTYYDATDPRKLSAALRSSLQASRWHIEGGQAPRESLTLGQAATLPAPIEGTTDTYDVVFEGGAATPRRRVSVKGDEGLELFVEGRGRSLAFRRYDGGNEQGIRDSSGVIPDPLSAERTWFVAAHLARREGNAVTFPVSVQNGVADGFSPKPVELWAQLQPMGPAGPVGLPYTFFDLDFQPGRPVPVVDLRAKDWPPAADAAEVKTWFRFEPAEAEVAISVTEFLPAIERRVPLKNLPGSSLLVLVKPIDSPTSLKMTVIEEHPPALAAALPLLRVTVSPACRRAVHMLTPGGSRVRHEFVLAMIDGQLPPDVMLTATRAETIKRGAVGPPSPGSDPKRLSVPVPAP